jgi:hypothetical protein
VVLIDLLIAMWGITGVLTVIWIVIKLRITVFGFFKKDKKVDLDDKTYTDEKEERS